MQQMVLGMQSWRSKGKEESFPHMHVVLEIIVSIVV
jgi:hypothetical protein